MKTRNVGEDNAYCIPYDDYEYTFQTTCWAYIVGYWVIEIRKEK